MPKQTRSKKKSTISSNGDHPSKAFLSPQPKIDVESAADESEGWRYIEKAGKNGQVEYERVPLTTYELLHPKEGYTIVHASPHDINTAYIGNSAKINLRGTPEARVFGDLRTDLNLLGIEPVSPDVSVMFDVSQEQIWTTFNCQKEGIYPCSACI